MIGKHYLACAFISVAMVAGCSNDQSQGDVIATVGDEAITDTQFDAYLKFKNVPADNSARRDKELENYLQREALAAAIAQQEQMDEAMIEAEVREFRKQALLSRYFDTYLAEQVTEQAIKNYYNSHIDEFTEEKAHLAHILLRTNPKMSDNEKKAQLNKAHEAYSKLQSGADFAEVAEQYSEDTVSAKRGGDLGWVKQGAIDANFTAQAFKLDAGEYSEPMATTFGYHIVKQLEAPKKINEPYENVKGKIRHILRQAAKEAEYERLQALVKVETK